MGGIDILVNNAAHQATFKDIGDISDEEWEMTFKVNIHAMFYLTKAAVPSHETRERHREHGIGQLRHAEPDPASLRDDKGAIQNFTGGLAQMLARKGISG